MCILSLFHFFHVCSFCVSTLLFHVCKFCVYIFLVCTFCICKDNLAKQVTIAMAYYSCTDLELLRKQRLEVERVASAQYAL